MTNQKLSSIAPGSTPTSSDQFVGVQGGTTDALYTGSQVNSAVYAGISGDGTISSTGNLVVTKTSGTAFGALATQNTVNLATTGNGGVAGVLSASNFTNTAPATYFSGNWYVPMPAGNNVIGTSTVANTIYMNFGYVPQTVTIKSLAFRLANPGTGGNAQLAIYSYSGTTLNLVDKTASMTTNVATTVTAPVGNTTDVLSPGVLYAFCMNSSTGSQWQSAGDQQAQILIGSTSATACFGVLTGSLISGKSASSTFGSWPSSITSAAMTDTLGSIVPIVAFQVN